MPFNSFAFALPLFYGMGGEGLPGRSEWFFKDVDKPFPPGNKSFGGKGKRKFSEIMHSVCRVTGK